MFYIVDIYWDVPYEASGTITMPIEFDGTLEELKFEFKLAVEGVIKRGNHYFNFKNLEKLEVYLFWENRKYSSPQFYELNEWFKHYGIKI